MPLLAGGYQPENLPNLRLAWVVTALFFLVAALPTFLFLRERAPRGTATALEYVRAGFARLADDRPVGAALLGAGALPRRLLRLLAGLTSVVAFAGIYAEQTLGFTRELIFLFIVLQLSSAAGAFLFGSLQDRLGAVAHDPDHPGPLDPGLRGDVLLRQTKAALLGRSALSPASGSARSNPPPGGWWASSRRRRRAASSSASGASSGKGGLHAGTLHLRPDLHRHRLPAGGDALDGRSSSSWA